MIGALALCICPQDALLVKSLKLNQLNLYVKVLVAQAIAAELSKTSSILYIMLIFVCILSVCGK